MGSETFSGCGKLKSIRFEYATSTLEFGEIHYDTFYITKIADWTNTLERIFIDRRLNDKITNLNALKELTLGENLESVDISIKNSSNLTTIISHAAIPPELPICTNSQYINVIVKVPNDAIETYKQAEGWKNFWNIEAIGTSGVQEIQSVTEKAEIGRYNLLGAPVSENYDGIVIIRYSDGSTKKVMNKS